MKKRQNSNQHKKSNRRKLIIIVLLVILMLQFLVNCNKTDLRSYAYWLITTVPDYIWKRFLIVIKAVHEVVKYFIKRQLSIVGNRKLHPVTFIREELKIFAHIFLTLLEILITFFAAFLYILGRTIKLFVLVFLFKKK